MMTLPSLLEEEFWQEYRDFEESLSMQYVTSVERFGIICFTGSNAIL
ncbi:hypothetical protein ACWATR_00480 [Nostoc sp. UIC 10890]